MMKYMQWHYEYLYFIMPTLDPSGHNYEQIMRYMDKTDFNTQEAQIFKAGWMAHAKQIKSVLKEVKALFHDTQEID